MVILVGTRSSWCIESDVGRWSMVATSHEAAQMMRRGVLLHGMSRMHSQ